MGCSGSRDNVIARAGLAVLCALGWGTATFAECRDDVVELRGDWGRARFSVEVADTIGERSKGLMYRETLPRSAGMLFVYDKPQRVAFWMKNTLIPLDMIFVDSAGRVTRVHSNAMPHDETPIPGGDGVVAVLEVNGGLAKRLGITEGTAVRSAVFAQATAVWPCDAE